MLGECCKPCRPPASSPAFVEAGHPSPEDQKAPSEIAKLLGRDKSVMTRLLVKRVPRKPLGRRPILKPQRVDALVARCDALVKKADGNYQVTTDMIKKNARIQACNRVVLGALHSRGVYLRPMREKPVLTQDDAPSPATLHALPSPLMAPLP